MAGMTLRSAPTSDTLSAWVQQDFGVDITTLGSVGHGADESAQLWRGFGADGASYAVKLSEAGTPAGLIVSAHLAEHGVAGVPRPLMSRNGSRGASESTVGSQSSHECQRRARSKAR